MAFPVLICLKYNVKRYSVGETNGIVPSITRRHMFAVFGPRCEAVCETLWGRICRFSSAAPAQATVHQKRRRRPQNRVLTHLGSCSNVPASNQAFVASAIDSSPPFCFSRSPFYTASPFPRACEVSRPLLTCDATRDPPKRHSRPLL